MTGDQNDWQVNAERRHLRLKVETAHARKPHIQHKASCAIRATNIEELLHRAVAAGSEAHRPAQTIHRVTKGLIVIDDVDDRVLSALLRHKWTIRTSNRCSSNIISAARVAIKPKYG